MDKIPYCFPLVIGTTGHRDLRTEDIPRLERAVADVIEQLKRDYLSDDTETPIIVLSALAEGADQLVASVGLACGATLIAPFPMSPEEYRQDFEPGLKPDAVAEFDRLKKQAIALPITSASTGNSPETAGNDAAHRVLAYREVGLFIVRHCHVLIALWDGDEGETAVGGTMEVVNFKRNGIPLEVGGSPRASLDAPEIGPVIHIVTPRARHAGNAVQVEVRPWGREVVKLHLGGRLARCWRSTSHFVESLLSFDRSSEEVLGQSVAKRREFESWTGFETQIGLTRSFNEDAAALGPSGRDTGSRGDNLALFGNASRMEVPEGAKRPEDLLPRWCAMFTIADRLALARQSRVKRDWFALFLLGFAAIVSFEVVTHLVHTQVWLFGVYSAVFICVFGWFILARLGHHQERFLDYRALAEALRVAVFWKLLGIGVSTQSAERSPKVDLSSGESVADAYPIRQPSELDWVKTCLRVLELIDAGEQASRTGDRVDANAYTWARRFWIEGQLEFFRYRGPRHNRLAEVLENHSFVLLFLSTVVAASLFTLDLRLFGSLPHWEHDELRHRLFVFAVGLWPGLAAVIAGFSEKLAFKAQARQYDRMRVLFERAYSLLPEAVDPPRFRQMQALFAELGAEVLKENASWVEIYRQRPIRPP
jgi:hypothetical protein